MSKQGQLISIDFIGSVVIFFILLTTLFLFWNTSTTKFNNNLERDKLLFTLVKITDLFVEHQGIPTNWNVTNVQVIGLVEKDRTLDTNKLIFFKNLTYNRTRQLLNIEPYEFYFRIIDRNGAIVTAQNQAMEVGSFTPSVKEPVVTIRRFVLYGSRKVIIEFSAWK